MKKIKIFISVFICFVFINQQVHSQVKIWLGPEVGLTVPTGDYGGTTVDFYNGAKYGLGTGVNFGALAKFKLTVLTIRGGINYSAHNNSGNSDPENPNSFIEVKQNMLTIFAGPEFSFKIPSSPVLPYLGADLLFTSLSGETTFQGVARVPSGTFSMSGASRLGLGIGGGVEFHFGKKYALDLGLRYNFINLIGKKFEELPSDARVDSYTNLNDDQDPNYAVDPNDHPISNSRSISTFQVNLAFLFGL